MLFTVITFRIYIYQPLVTFMRFFVVTVLLHINDMRKGNTGLQSVVKVATHTISEIARMLFCIY